ncbi:MAG: hypothetical protein KID02_16770 [Clostridiales bacterium]|nr:hypothetical protein [Clostridiales bacterium]
MMQAGLIIIRQVFVSTNMISAMNYVKTYFRDTFDLVLKIVIMSTVLILICLGRSRGYATIVY